MFHIADVIGDSSYLIEIGVLLQVIAICAYMRDSFTWRPFTHSKEVGGDAHEQGLESRISDQAEKDQADPTRDESLTGGSPTQMKTGTFTRTAKVKFVQKFNFRRPGY